MGLDMYLDKRLKKYSDQIYVDAQHLNELQAATRAIENGLQFLKNTETDKILYVTKTYPSLFDKNQNFIEDFIFCSYEKFNNQRPVLHQDDSEKDLFFDSSLETDQRYTWTTKQFTKDKVIELIYDNDSKELKEAYERCKKEIDKLKHVPSDISLADTVTYWRKANHIHNWIIRHGTKRTDDVFCHVSIESIKELIEVCKKVLKEHTTSYATTYLPTTEGFFFGKMTYDEWYYQDLKYTVEQLTNVLKNHDEKYRYVYIASY